MNVNTIISRIISVYFIIDEEGISNKLISGEVRLHNLRLRPLRVGSCKLTGIVKDVVFKWKWKKLLALNALDAVSLELNGIQVSLEKKIFSKGQEEFPNVITDLSNEGVAKKGKIMAFIDDLISHMSISIKDVTVSWSSNLSIKQDEHKVILECGSLDLVTTDGRDGSNNETIDQQLSFQNLRGKVTIDGKEFILLDPVSNKEVAVSRIGGERFLSSKGLEVKLDLTKICIHLQYSYVHLVSEFLDSIMDSPTPAVADSAVALKDTPPEKINSAEFQNGSGDDYNICCHVDSLLKITCECISVIIADEMEVNFVNCKVVLSDVVSNIQASINGGIFIDGKDIFLGIVQFGLENWKTDGIFDQRAYQHRLGDANYVSVLFKHPTTTDEPQQQQPRLRVPKLLTLHQYQIKTIFKIIQVLYPLIEEEITDQLSPQQQQQQQPLHQQQSQPKPQQRQQQQQQQPPLLQQQSQPQLQHQQQQEKLLRHHTLPVSTKVSEHNSKKSIDNGKEGGGRSKDENNEPEKEEISFFRCLIIDELDICLIKDDNQWMKFSLEGFACYIFDSLKDFNMTTEFEKLVYDTSSFESTKKTNDVSQGFEIANARYSNYISHGEKDFDQFQVDTLDLVTSKMDFLNFSFNLFKEFFPEQLFEDKSDPNTINTTNVTDNSNTTNATNNNNIIRNISNSKDNSDEDITDVYLPSIKIGKVTLKSIEEEKKWHVEIHDLSSQAGTLDRVLLSVNQVLIKDVDVLYGGTLDVNNLSFSIDNYKILHGDFQSIFIGVPQKDIHLLILHSELNFETIGQLKIQSGTISGGVKSFDKSVFQGSLEISSSPLDDEIIGVYTDLGFCLSPHTDSSDNQGIGLLKIEKSHLEHTVQIIFDLIKLFGKDGNGDDTIIGNTLKNEKQQGNLPQLDKSYGNLLATVKKISVYASDGFFVRAEDEDNWVMAQLTGFALGCIMEQPVGAEPTGSPNDSDVTLTIYSEKINYIASSYDDPGILLGGVSVVSMEDCLVFLREQRNKLSEDKLDTKLNFEGLKYNAIFADDEIRDHRLHFSTVDLLWKDQAVFNKTLFFLDNYRLAIVPQTDSEPFPNVIPAIYISYGSINSISTKAPSNSYVVQLFDFSLENSTLSSDYDNNDNNNNNNNSNNNTDKVKNMSNNPKVSQVMIISLQKTTLKYNLLKRKETSNLRNINIQLYHRDDITNNNAMLISDMDLSLGTWSVLLPVTQPTSTSKIRVTDIQIEVHDLSIDSREKDALTSKEQTTGDSPKVTDYKFNLRLSIGSVKNTGGALWLSFGSLNTLGYCHLVHTSATEKSSLDIKSIENLNVKCDSPTIEIHDTVNYRHLRDTCSYFFDEDEESKKNPKPAKVPIILPYAVIHQIAVTLSISNLHKTHMPLGVIPVHIDKKTYYMPAFDGIDSTISDDIQLHYEKWIDSAASEIASALRIFGLKHVGTFIHSVSSPILKTIVTGKESRGATSSDAYQPFDYCRGVISSLSSSSTSDSQKNLLSSVTSIPKIIGGTADNNNGVNNNNARIGTTTNISNNARTNVKNTNAVNNNNNTRQSNGHSSSNSINNNHVIGHSKSHSSRNSSSIHHTNNYNNNHNNNNNNNTHHHSHHSHHSRHSNRHSSSTNESQTAPQPGYKFGDFTRGLLGRKRNN